jgi:hypothetical protein
MFSACELRLVSYQSLCTLPYPLHTHAHTKEMFEERKEKVEGKFVLNVGNIPVFSRKVCLLKCHHVIDLQSE